jgi:hypothetical protein
MEKASRELIKLSGCASSENSMSDFPRLWHAKEEMMNAAIELFRAWAEQGSEEAFAG